MKKTGRSHGFSLIEVAIAVGIAGIGLIAIFGLLPVATTVTRSALSQEAATKIMAALYADMKGTPNTVTTSPQLGIQFGSGTTLYFDEGGQKVADPNDAAYRVTITFPAGSATATVANLRITWPAGANPLQPAGVVESFVAFDRQ